MVAVMGWIAWRRLGDAWRSPPPPVPVPASLGQLDPQVRAHLASLVTRIAELPRDPELRADFGLALAVNGLWTEARASFLDALALGIDGPLAAVYAAVALQEAGDFPGALTELESVVARFPDSAPAWHRLATLRVATGDLTGAQNGFLEVTRRAPGEWRGWAGLGEVALRSGAVQEAIPALERAVNLDPYARSARHLLGQAYRVAGRAAEADRELAAGTESSLSPMPDPWSARALAHMKLLPDQFERADALVAQGRAPEAVRLLAEAQRFHPTNVAVITRLAAALDAASDAPAAWRLLGAALARSPREVPLLIAAAHVAAALGESERALALARQALELAPQSADGHVALANARLAAEDDAGAVAALEAALNLAPRNVGLLIQLGDLHGQNLASPENAIACFQRALALDPIHPVALQRLTLLLLEMGRRDAAAAALADLRRLTPDSPAVRELEAQWNPPPAAPRNDFP